MGIEIERKFLVKKNLWEASANNGANFKQAYLSQGGPCSVRVRREGNKANLNIKSATLGIVRQEFEYSIPLDEAEELLSLFCDKTVTKKRYKIDYAGKTWEIDVFTGDNDGLIVAEIELDHPDEDFELPPWAGDEVSGEARYYNTELARHPFCTWENS
ncbi:MAG: CYTH domain-containing protein [Arenicellales bacterium]